MFISAWLQEALPAEVAVKVLGDGAAVRYIARIVIEFPGGHDDGRFWHTDLYARRGDAWQAVWSQATWIPRPPGAG